MTMFCDLGAISSPPPAPAPRTKSVRGASTLVAATSVGQRRRSSAIPDQKSPSYRNNFNEQSAGIEGHILNTILNPLVSKLMTKTTELYLPENMVKMPALKILLKILEPLSRCSNACFIRSRVSR